MDKIGIPNGLINGLTDKNGIPNGLINSQGVSRKIDSSSSTTTTILPVTDADYLLSAD